MQKHFIDPFWYLGFLLVGLSGLYQYAAMARRAYHEGIAPAQQSKQAAPGPPSPGDRALTAGDSLKVL
jgi:hypothetical protein